MLNNPTMCLRILFILVVLSGAPSAFAQNNDSFANRLALTGASATAVTNNLKATREAGEPRHAGINGARSLWWTWTAPTTGTVNFSTVSAIKGNNYVPGTAVRSLAVYTGSSLSSISEVANAAAFPSSAYGSAAASVPAAMASLNVAVMAGTTYQIVVDAPSYAGLPDDGTVILSLNQAPTISSLAGMSGTVGDTFSYLIKGTNNPTGFGATNVPPGLSFNASTGELSGQLPAAGVYSIGLTATNPGGTGKATLTVTVNPANVARVEVPVIYSAAAGAGFVGVTYSSSLSANNAASYGASNLPSGLSLDVVSGTLAGVPTAAGTYEIPITATNALGTGQAVFTLTIAEAPPRPVIRGSLSATGTVGSSFYSYIDLASPSSSQTPVSYGASNLPPGLGFDPGTGYIRGVPTTPGAYSVPISATTNGGTSQAVSTIVISQAATVSAGVENQAAPPVLNSSAALLGAVGVSFSGQLSASNSTTAFSASGLPPGMSLNPANGFFSGTPTAAGVYSVPVSATNAYGTANATLTINILAGALNYSRTYPPMVVTSPATADGYVGQSLVYQLTASPGGSYGYYSSSNVTYTVKDLPPGLSLRTFPYPNSIISGVPTVAGTYVVPVTVKASPPYTAGSATITFVIASGAMPAPVAVPVFMSAATVTTYVGAVYSNDSLFSASNSPTSYTASGLPPGLTVNASSGLVSGSPSTAGTYAATLSATNSAGKGDATVTFLVATEAPTAKAPVITSTATASGTVGAAFSYSLTASNSPTARTADNLPPGLTFNGTTGDITGTPTVAGVYRVPISATNDAGTSTAMLTVTIAAGPGFPYISGYASARGSVGSSFSYSIYASGSPTGYTASNLPPGLTLDSSSGAISGTPSTAGVYRVPISVTNAVGTSSVVLTCTIAPTAAPVFSGYAVTNGVVGSTFSYYLGAYSSITGYTADNLPPGLTLNSTTGYVTGTPTAAGVYRAPISATNAGGTTSVTLTFSITGAAAANPPVFTSAAAASGVVGGAFSYVAAASNSPTSYSLGTNPPPGLSFDAITGRLSGTPTAAGTYVLPVAAYNAAGKGEGKITLNFSAQPAAAPVITSPMQFMAYNPEAMYYPVAATNQPTSYAASGLPAGLVIDPTTGVISGQVNPLSANSSVVVTATNSVGQGKATLTCINPSRPVARITSPLSASGATGAAFAYNLTTNATAYSYSASGLPPGLSLSSSTGKISGTPTVSGAYTTSVSSSTSYGSVTAKVAFYFAASTAQQPDLTSAASARAAAGDLFYYPLTATNNPTSITVTNLPGGLSYDSAKAMITGAPASAGTFNVSIRAANNSGVTNATLTLFVATVADSIVKINSPAAAGTFVGSPFSYTVTTDPVTAYSLYANNLPPGLTYNSNTLKITGTPTTPGTYSSNLSVSANQGSCNGVLTISVDATSNTPPVISSSAGATVPLGRAFSYTLTATGLSGSFTATNLPAGLSFNPETGALSGAPTVSGTFNIPLTASNPAGTGSAVLTLTVTPAPPSLVNTSLTGSASLGYSTVVYRIQAPGATSFGASNLPPGLSLDPVTGVIGGVPTSVGTFQTAISAANAYGTADAVIAVTINNPASAPQLSSVYITQSGQVGESFYSSMYVSGTGAIVSADNLPPGLYLNRLSGEIFGTPSVAGNYPVTISATNAVGTDSLITTISVKALPSIPGFSTNSAMLTGRVGEPFSRSVSTSGATTYAVSGLPTGMSYLVSGSTIYLAGTPEVGGTFFVTLTLGNKAGTSNEVLTLVIAGEPPAVPIINSPAGSSGYVGVPYSYGVSASPRPGAYSATGLPDGLQINVVTGVIGGTPKTAGSFPISVAASNPSGTGRAVFTLRVDSAVPAAYAVPRITSAASAYYSSDSDSYSYYYPYPTAAFSYTITATNTPTSFTASNLPSGLSLNPSTGVISGRPLVSGTFSVPLSATNAAGTSKAVLTIVTLTALPSVVLPLMTTGQVDAYEILYVTSSYYYYPYTNSVEPLSYSTTGLPPGLSMDTTRGIITGAPSQVGTYQMTITVTNRAGSTSAVVTFVVGAAGPAVPVQGGPPVITGDAVLAGFVGVPVNKYLYSGGSYTAANLPPGLSIDAAQGRITGTPTAAGTFTVPITATNNYGTGSATLTVQIAAAPAAPIISSGAGKTVNVGSPCSLVLYTDSSFGSIWPAESYGASNLPPGLTINTASGFITGTPTVAGRFAVPVFAVAGGVVGRATLTIEVLPGPAVPSPSTPIFSNMAGDIGYVGASFQHILGAPNFSPDVALPAGLSYAPAQAAIQGFPTAAGNYDLPFSANGSGGGTAGRGVFNLRVITPDLSLPVIINQPAGVTAASGTQVSFTAMAFGFPTPAFQWFHDGLPVVGATGLTLTLPTSQASDTGQYVLVARNSSGSATSSSALLVVTQNFANWQADHFTKDEIALGSANPGYDFNHDGLPNLLEYALGRDPRTGAGGSLPFETRPTNGSLQLQFTRDLGKADLTYIVEASSDLSSWTPIARSASGGATTNLGGALSITESRLSGGAVTVIVQDGQPNNLAGRRFLRLRVNLP